jgi:hypothetical protein
MYPADLLLTHNREDVLIRPAKHLSNVVIGGISCDTKSGADALRKEFGLAKAYKSHHGMSIPTPSTDSVRLVADWLLSSRTSQRSLNHRRIHLPPGEPAIRMGLPSPRQAQACLDRLASYTLHPGHGTPVHQLLADERCSSRRDGDGALPLPPELAALRWPDPARPDHACQGDDQDTIGNHLRPLAEGTRRRHRAEPVLCALGAPRHLREGPLQVLALPLGTQCGGCRLVWVS